MFSSTLLLFNQAVCCADHLHCCPRGYTCDSSSGQCLQNPDAMGYIGRLFSSASTTPLLLKSKSKDLLESSVVVCPDKEATCPEGMTCCLTKDQQYACCPMPKVIYYCVLLT